MAFEMKEGWLEAWLQHSFANGRPGVSSFFFLAVSLLIYKMGLIIPPRRVGDETECSTPTVAVPGRWKALNTSWLN